MIDNADKEWLNEKFSNVHGKIESVDTKVVDLTQKIVQTMTTVAVQDQKISSIEKDIKENTRPCEDLKRIEKKLDKEVNGRTQDTKNKLSKIIDYSARFGIAIILVILGILIKSYLG